MLNPFSQYATAAKLIGGAIVAGLLVGVGCWIGAQDGDRRAAKAEIALANYKRDVAQELALSEAKARKVERERNEAVSKAAANYEQGKQDAEAEAKRVAAGISDGSVRLRKQWAACETGRLSDRAATAGELEAARQLRAEAIGRILGIGREADASQKALIEAYEAQRAK